MRYFTIFRPLEACMLLGTLTMGFVMLATAVYLMSFMPVPAVVPTITTLLGIAIAVWFAARTPVYAAAQERIQAWAFAGLIVVASVIVSFGWLENVMQNHGPLGPEPKNRTQIPWAFRLIKSL